MKNLFLTLAAGTLLSANALASPGDSFLQNCQNPLRPGNSRGVASPELEQVNESTQVLKNYLGAVDCVEAAGRLAKITDMDLSHVKINSLANFNDLTELKALWVNGPELQDLSHLKNLDKLIDLWLIAGKTRTLDGLEENRSLLSISIVGESLTNIQAIKTLSPTSLLLDASQLTDVTPIAELNSLTSLQLHVKSAPKLPNLENLYQLQSAWISTDSAADFSPLTGLSAVQDLWVSGAQFNSLKDLVSLSKLKSLTIANSKLSTLAELKDLAARSELEAFHSVNNPISSGEELANLPNLKSLALVGTNIKKTDFLVDLSQLESLDLSQNPGIDVSPVAQKTALKDLNLAGIGVSQTAFLQGLTGLKSLSAPYNQLAGAPELKTLKNLETLNLSGNRLSNTNDMSELNSLQVLFLNDNPIGQDIERLVNTPTLEVLGLANTGLTGRPTFPAWKKLKVMDLSNNDISDVFAVGDLQDLERLNLANNKISNFNPIMGIAATGNPADAKLLPWLHELNSEGNAVPYTQNVPSGYAIEALNNKGLTIQLELQAAQTNYDKVAFLDLGSDQAVEDIQCLKVYYHYKHIGVLNSIMPTFPKAGVLNDHLSSICIGSRATGCVKAVYGQDLASCRSFGNIGELSPTIKPIISIGDSNTVKLNPAKMIFVTGDAKRELQEVKSIKDLIGRLSGSQNNSDTSVEDVKAGFQQELDKALATARDFMARIDRIRASNHKSLQDARRGLNHVTTDQEGI
jgi:hypothetical protein